MSDSNRVRLTGVAEVTPGTTPGTPRMRTLRMTGESLSYQPTLVTSDEIRADRMNTAPVKVGETNGGAVNFELHYPLQDSLLSSVFESSFMAAWSNMNSRDNDGTADSVITNVAATGGVVTVTTGTAFVAGQLVRLSGFTNSGNNGLFKLTTGSATVPAVGNSLLTDEAAPPAAARMKVVGFQGASGDITATATGLGSTSLDFTTLGLVVGGWVKIGATGSGFRFATSALNDWARITTIAATALTLDNLPSGWTTDSGTGKTIRVFTGDTLKNGTTKKGLSLERGFMDQSAPTYLLQKGMVGNTLTLNFTAKQKITGSVEFLGMSGAQSTSSQDASPDDAPSDVTYPIMAASANVGRVGEAGSTLTSPNFVQSLTVKITNNLAAIESVDSAAPVDIGEGSCDVEAVCTTYFGDNALLTKLFAGTATSLNARVTKGSQAVIVGLPNLTATQGNPNAGGKNQRVTLPLTLMAAYDSTTGAQVVLSRFEYFEV